MFGLAAGQLGGQREADGAVSPAGDAGGSAPAEQLRVLPHEGIRGDHHARSPVGHLAAVVAAGPALDDRVGVVVTGEALGAEPPGAGLGPRVRPGVAVGELGEPVEVHVVDPVAPVVLVGHVRERGRPHEPRPAFVTDPGRGTEVLCGDVTRHRALQLGTHHERHVVAPRFDLGGGGQDGDAARGARRLVARRRQPPQLGIDGGRHGPEVPLPGEQLPERVAHVDRVDLRSGDPGVRQRLTRHLGDQPVDRAAIPRPVPREVALVPTQHPDPLPLPHVARCAPSVPRPGRCARRHPSVPTASVDPRRPPAAVHRKAAGATVRAGRRAASQRQV